MVVRVPILTLVASGCLYLLGCDAALEQDGGLGERDAGPAGVGADAPGVGGGASSGGTAAPAAGGGAPAIDAGSPAKPPAAGPGAPSRGTIPEECWGFPLAGLRYSPGGDTLPNKCAPFHPTLNNPYAVRCIDAYPDFDSGFPGDEYCILPPPPGKGIQIGFHPQGTVAEYWEQIWAGDYSGYADVGSEWLVGNGEERTEGYRMLAANRFAHRYYRTYFRMRTGAHHAVYTLHARSGKPSGWDPEQGDITSYLLELSATVQSLGGQQQLSENVPVAIEAPPENEGLYFTWPARPEVLINVHSFNPTSGPVLREGWTNVWWAPDGTRELTWIAGLDPLSIPLLHIEPGQIADYHYAIDVVAPGRILSLFGHRHAWTTEFLTWIERSNGDTQIVYRSLDWSDMPTYYFDSATQNPPVTAAHADGAASGIVELSPGDRVHFNCHVEYTDARAIEVGAPMLPVELGPLVWANEAYTAEMCAQFGAVLGRPFDAFPYAVEEPVPSATDPSPVVRRPRWVTAGPHRGLQR